MQKEIVRHVSFIKTWSHFIYYYCIFYDTLKDIQKYQLNISLFLSLIQLRTLACVKHGATLNRGAQGDISPTFVGGDTYQLSSPSFQKYFVIFLLYCMFWIFGCFRFFNLIIPFDSHDETILCYSCVHFMLFMCSSLFMCSFYVIHVFILCYSCVHFPVKI